ncbi:MAG: transcription termination factor NusA [Candidatus Pacebacteria bacterium]|nr:transcription termination factor NusA [Candidatus Paceibacterota bacterium]
MDFQEFLSAITQLAEEKGLSKEVIIEGVEHALASAYKKEYGKKGQIIKGKMNIKTGKTDFYRTRLVVDPTMVYIPLPKEDEEPEAYDFEIKEEYRPLDHEINFADDANQNVVVRDDRRVRYNQEKHILIEEVEKEGLSLVPRDELIIPLEQKDDFGRIAAQTAKQVVLQKIREAEKDAVIAEYKSKEGEIVSGIIQKIEGSNIYFDIGKTSGVLMREEQIRGEFYKEGQRLKLYIVKVDTTSKGPIIVLSRIYPKLVSKLFELEVPEINAGQIEIKSLAREPGSRTKIAVVSCMDGIDPIGSMVGQRGVRVAAVINELGGEKIDVIEYSDDPADYIKNALSPAKVLEVKILPKNTALVVVPNDQLSLAIGKDGQNVRLSARLTGWKIEVKSLDEFNKDFDEDELDIEEEGSPDSGNEEASSDNDE